jgi:uncharacterized protein YbjT (DUF2867 family)
MLLVVGATGTTGREVVKALRAAKAPFRALVRNGKVAKAMHADGIEAVVGDLAKPKTLDAAAAGVERVFVATTASPEMPEEHGHLYAAAKKAGVKQVVRLGALGSAPDSSVSILRRHAEAEQALKESGLAWTLLRPHFFMQNFVTYFADMIANQDAFYLPLGKARLGIVDVRDTAAIAARALTTSGHEGKAYDVTGPDVLSMEEAAQKISVVAGRRVGYADITPEAARAGMTHAKMPGWMVDGLLEMYAHFREGKGAVISTAVLDVTGKMARSFDRFLHDHRASFVKA